MNYDTRLERKRWFKANAAEYCYNLTNEQLTDSPLARLACWAGHDSLTTVLNNWNAWGMTVCEIETMLLAQIDGE